MNKTKTFKELIVWQKSRDLAVMIYKVTDNFPKSEMYGLTNQMRRAVISIPSNLAEGYNRYHPKKKRQFLSRRRSFITRSNEDVKQITKQTNNLDTSL